MDMLRVTFSVGSATPYRVPSLELPGLVHEIQADLEDGDHTFISPDFTLGTIHSLGSKPLIGRLEFRYTYSARDRRIIVCDTDYPSADGMTLITMPEGTELACFEHAAPAGFVADEIYGNGTWNYYSQLMPGAADHIKGIAHNANEALISALVKVKGLFVRIRKLPPKLSMDTYLNLAVVYRDGKFLEMLDSNKQYDAPVVIKTIESTYGGKEIWPEDTNFANVKGSTEDPKIKSKSWIELWREDFGDVSQCTSLDYMKFKCDKILKGGHSIQGKVAMEMKAGSTVYILPICTAHNNNDNTYMATITNCNVVVLDNYLES